VSLDIIGDGPARGELNDLATTLGISGRVRFLGELPQPALAEHYRAATALVVPSTGEGLGLVAVEAMMCRTPVVAFESGGLVDVVQHDRTGILVPAGDVAALAKALDDLLARPDRGAALGEAGRMYVLSTFAPESAAQRYADVYRSALAAVAT
jgi:glycosyltransferase involved in cell wall biosynthesis